MAEIMDGPRDAGADRRPAGRPGDEGRAARRRSSASRGRCARMRCSCRGRTPTCSTRAAPAATGPARFNISSVRGARRRRVRRARRQARQPIGVEPVRQRRRVRGARRRRSRRRRRSSSAAWTRPASRSSSRRRSTRRCGTRRRRGASSGVRTAFNLLGPLTNPAGATRQLVGVPRPELTELLARALLLLGSERAWVVHGADGIDEISTTGYTKVSECRDGAVQHVLRAPRRLRPAARRRRRARGGDARDNAAHHRAACSPASAGRRATSCC